MKIRFTSVVVLASILMLATGARAQCPGDVNDDGMVGFDDLVQLLGNWGACTGCPEDIDGDDLVGFTDLTILLGNWGCTASPTTTLTGTVINAWTSTPIEGATVTVGDEVATTGSNGSYEGDFPSGQQTVVIAANNYISEETTLVLLPDFTTTLDAALEPVAAVVVEVEVSGDTDPGGNPTATAIIDILDGSTFTGIMWSQVSGTRAVLTGINENPVMVDLGDLDDYKAQLYEVLTEPPISAEDLPPNVPLPEGEFHGGIQNRFELTPTSPFSLEEAGLVGLEAAVTTTSGTYAGEGDVHSHLPWKPVQGIETVPIGIPVLLHGKDQAAYNWALVLPNNSNATLLDPTTRTPEFTPDVAGTYEVTVTDMNAGAPVSILIYAGNWRGVIIGQGPDGRPESETTCVLCHQNLGSDEFQEWRFTGHAEIFTRNLDTSTHYGPNCFPCHTVGFDPEVDNGGFDDSQDYQAFLDSGLLNNPGDNWTDMLAMYPDTARRGNAQCENCHGPQWALPGVTIPSHGPLNPPGMPRASLASDVCATCHGEPLRHARFQQWQLSGHANYELAIDESQSGNCSRCHTANGFLTWLPVLNGDEPGDPLDDIMVTWTEDQSHPQTCATCHDPHMIGTTSGSNTNATVRISGNTPPLIAGFTAFGVGRGAICMTCHNSRRGLRNESTWPEYAGTSEAARAPHGSAQTDMLMGQNAYLIATGIRGGHSFTTDTCAQCHMVRTPPPDVLSYNSGGTNHTFFARTDICVDCHGNSLEADFIQNAAQETMDFLQGLVEDALLVLITEQIDLGNKIDLNGAAVITDAATIADIEFGESRGRQAITVTFTDTTVVGPTRMNDVLVLDADDVVLGELYDFADDSLPKAGWNWALVHNDGSRGVHNPTFSFATLDAAIEALGGSGAATAAPVDWRSIVELGYGANRAIGSEAPKRR